jgi:hypothetical protein
VPSGNVADPKHWYARAAEMRTLADEIRDVEARAMMFRLANDYDKLGDRAAERTHSKHNSKAME